MDEKKLNDKGMKRNNKKLWVLLPLGLVFLMLLSSCIQIVAATPEQTKTADVIYVTQVITEIIPPTPIPVTPTATKTFTPEPPTATPTWDPLNAPIYYPIKDCVASRLHAGQKAMVSLEGGPNGIRYGLDLYYDTLIAYAQPGSVLEILNGPWCSHGWIVWLVRTADGTVGYTPEGDGDAYWLLPMPPF
jgi:hypothetical protein